MARRVKRRSQDELLIHKWWVNLILMTALFGASYGLTYMALNSNNALEYFLAACSAAWAVNRALAAHSAAADR